MRAPSVSRAPPFDHHRGPVGGASRGWVGEVVLAHNGVLFLDELSEFSRATLESLRQPLEDGRVAIVRARHSAVYPARVMLVAATNPCPCGYLGEAERCRCSEADMARHRRKLSGPLLDRIDLVAALERPARARCASAPTTSSQEVREQVLAARERQAARLKEEGVSTNAQMDARMLRAHIALDESGEETLRSGAGARRAERPRTAPPAARGAHGRRPGGAARTGKRHLAEALGWRAEAALESRRAA